MFSDHNDLTDALDFTSYEESPTYFYERHGSKGPTLRFVGKYNRKSDGTYTSYAFINSNGENHYFSRQFLLEHPTCIIPEGDPNDISTWARGNI